MTESNGLSPPLPLIESSLFLQQPVDAMHNDTLFQFIGVWRFRPRSLNTRHWQPISLVFRRCCWAFGLRILGSEHRSSRHCMEGVIVGSTTAHS